MYQGHKLQIENADTIESYGYVLVFARYQGRWVFFQPLRTDFMEAFGGAIEKGEMPLEAARRELYAGRNAPTNPRVVCDFAVYGHSFFEAGQVFFVELKSLDDFQAFCSDQIRLVEHLPVDLAFYPIVSAFFHHLQGWLNLQSAPEEIWDIYDLNRNPTGRTHRRGDPLAPLDFHLVVHVWIMNSNGEFLISQRAPTKGYPLMWECTGGSALAGDDSRAAAIREVQEELGLGLTQGRGVCVFTIVRRNDFCDVWLFTQNFEIEDVRLQKSETVDVRWATEGEIRGMVESGEFLRFDYLDELFAETGLR